MPTTRKQKKTRKSRGLEILSDIENLDIMLGNNHFNGIERERSLDSNSARRRNSVASDNQENEDESLYSNCRNNEPRTSADLGQNSAEANSLAEINRLSSELNSRISREMDDMLNNVSSQIQRAINEAINSQVLPQIQNAMMAGSVHETRRGWEVPAERPETDAEEQRNPNARTNCRNERHDVRQKGGISNHNVHDNPTEKQMEKSNDGSSLCKEETCQTEKEYKCWKLLSQLIDRVMFVLYVGALAVGITKHALEFLSYH